MIPIDAPAPNPSGNSINQNHDNARPTVGKIFSSNNDKQLFTADPIDGILPRTPIYISTNNTITQKYKFQILVQ